MAHIDLLNALLSAGIAALPGERWAAAPDSPHHVVSTEGRAFRLPRVIVQETRYGGTCTRHLKGHLVDVMGENPRLLTENRGTYHARADLGRQVLAAFVRPPVGDEVAIRRNGVGWDCRLANLVWSSDRHAELLERFLAGADGCHATHDLEHAAIRLGIDRSVLGKVLTVERRRLSYAARPGPKKPADIAAEIIEARKQAARLRPSQASGSAKSTTHPHASTFAATGLS